VKLLDGLITSLFGLEDNEAEASGPTGVAVDSHTRAHNFVLAELIVEGVVVNFPGQTTDKCLDLWWWGVVYNWRNIVVGSWSWGTLPWWVLWCFSVHS
jgi:hypothetical protein